jgi:hypothetical protein
MHPDASAITQQAKDAEMTEPNNENQPEFQHFPDIPDAAMLIAITFKKLGVQFLMGDDGSKGVSIPMCPRLTGGIPILSEARPHERFANETEYRGALKMIGYLISRLSENDKDFVWPIICTGQLPDGVFDFHNLIPGRAQS